MKKFSFRFQALPVLLRLCIPRPPKRPLAPIKSVVCIRPGKLGDMFVATPLFSALKKFGGVERLALICSPENEIVVRHNPALDICRAVNFHRIGAVMATIGWIRRQRFDAVFDLTPGFSRTNFLMSFIAGARTVRIGIEKELMADRYQVHVGNRTSHLADRILEAGERLTGSSFPRPCALEIFSTPADRAAAASFIDHCGGSDGLVAINLSSATASRQWPFGHFAKFITLCASAREIRKLLLIGVGPQAAWAQTLADIDHRCMAVPAMSLPAVTEVIAACRLLISTDTALIHAAAARNVPVMALYVGDAEAFARWKPYHGQGRVIQSRSGEPVASITPEAVFEETTNVLKELFA